MAGDTNPVTPAPEEVLSGETERPAPDQNPGLFGHLPRTGAGIMGEATLALMLIGGGLVLRLARRRRSSTQAS